MARVAISRSISFDAALWDEIEARRAKLRMRRSEYLARCIMLDLNNGGPLTFPELPVPKGPSTITNKREVKKKK